MSNVNSCYTSTAQGPYTNQILQQAPSSRSGNTNFLNTHTHCGTANKLDFGNSQTNSQNIFPIRSPSIADSGRKNNVNQEDFYKLIEALQPDSNGTATINNNSREALYKVAIMMDSKPEIYGKPPSTNSWLNRLNFNRVDQNDRLLPEENDKFAQGISAYLNGGAIREGARSNSIGRANAVRSLGKINSPQIYKTQKSEDNRTVGQKIADFFTKVGNFFKAIFQPLIDIFMGIARIMVKIFTGR